MDSVYHTFSTDDDLESIIKRIFDELDPVQMAVFRQMTPQEKIRRVSSLFAAMKKLAITSERHFHPELPEDEIYRRAMKRWMRASEWDEWTQNIFNL